MSATNDDTSNKKEIGQGSVGGWKLVAGKKVRSKQTKKERAAYVKKNAASGGAVVAADDGDEELETGEI